MLAHALVLEPNCHRQKAQPVSVCLPLHTLKPSCNAYGFPYRFTLPVEEGPKMERLPLQEESNLHFLESFRESHCCTRSVTRGPYTHEVTCRVQPAAAPPEITLQPLLPCLETHTCILTIPKQAAAPPAGKGELGGSRVLANI